jgi:hypothetical protein
VFKGEVFIENQFNFKGKKNMLISWNNINIFKWNKTYLHMYEIGKTQRFQNNNNNNNNNNNF